MFELLYGSYGFIAIKLIILHLLLTGLILYMKLLKKNGTELIGVAIIGECLTIISWYMLPSTIATILCAAAFIYSYEYLSAPKVRQGRNVVFESDHDIGQTLRQEQLGLRFEDENQNSNDGLFRVKTNLSYIEVNNTIQGENFSTFGIINIGKISRIGSRSCKAACVPSLTESDNYFNIILGWQQKYVTICGENQEECNNWKLGVERLVRYDFERRRNDFERKIFERTAEKHRLEDGSKYMDRELAVNTISKDMGFPLDVNSVKEFFKAHAIRSKDFQYLDCQKFTDFYRTITQIPSIVTLYERLLGDDYVLGIDKIRTFIEEEQKQKFSISLLKIWMKNIEKIAPILNFSQDGFTKFLLSDEQNIFNREFTTVYQDMKRPLSDYFIATSHNTYLTGDQLKSKSDVNMYVRALTRSCRCVELDIWDGKNEPIITHGHTLCSKITFLDVIKAIRQYAFEEKPAKEGEGNSWEERLQRMGNPFPVILSFENHCNLENQKIIAEMLQKELGEHLLTELPSGCSDTLPSPYDLRGKVIVKAKKLQSETEEESESESDDDDDEIVNEEEEIESTAAEETTTKPDSSNSNVSRKGSIFSPSKSSSKKVKVKVARELSDLIVICQAVHFKSFEDSAKAQNAHQMSSFAEGRSMKILKDEGKQFIKYNQRQLSRIYPSGKRVNSSNYDPVPLWCAGCQLVALNYQTSDRAMQINQGQFRDNGGCGYVLKPDILHRAEYSPNSQELKLQNYKVLVLKIISGHQLPATEKLFIQMQINGYENLKENRKVTKQQKCDGLYAEWNEHFSFKILLPELAHVSFRVKKASKDSDLAHYTLPFRCLQQGTRKVPLFDSKLNYMQFGYLLVHVEIKDSILTFLNN